MSRVKRIILIILLPVLGLVLFMKVTHQNINDVGLNFFQWVKAVRGDQVDLEALEGGVSDPIDHGDWTQLLKRHVGENGMVHYEGIVGEEKLLNSYLELISNNPPSGKWSEEEKIAYWINAYNAFTVRLILDHFPVQSIKDIAGDIVMLNSPWDLKFFKIGGVDCDLNAIEHEILRKQFDEPRIHFAVNCASISCPVLRNEAYTGDLLDKQLDEQAIFFINDTSKNIIARDELKLSMIFNWFESDFTKNGDLKEFIQQYITVDLNPDADVSFLPYDWGLNSIIPEG
jgi:hypothetical protein